MKFLRKARNWSQQEVADKLQISVPALSKMETGITTLTYSRMKQVVEIFGITMKHLTAREEEGLGELAATIRELKEKITEKEMELVKLQTLAISLYEELEAKKKMPRS